MYTFTKMRTKICGRRFAGTKICGRRYAQTKICVDEEMRTKICVDEEMRGRKNAWRRNAPTKKCGYEEMRYEFLHLRRNARRSNATRINAPTKICGRRNADEELRDEEMPYEDLSRAQSYQCRGCRCRGCLPRRLIHGTPFTQSHQCRATAFLFTAFCPRYNSAPAENTQRDWSILVTFAIGNCAYCLWTSIALYLKFCRAFICFRAIHMCEG